jgi:hypothetical protein
MCFSLEWIETLLIWLVIVFAVIAILRLLLPWVFSLFSTNPGPLLPIINIVVGAVLAIFVIYIAFALIACLMGGGGLSLFPHRT